MTTARPLNMHFNFHLQSPQLHLFPLLPPPPRPRPRLSCFLALNSLAQAGQGLIVAQAHKWSYKPHVYHGKMAPPPARLTPSLLGCSHLGQLFTSAAPSLDPFLVKIKNPGSKMHRHNPLLPPSMDNGTGPNVAPRPTRATPT